MSESPHDEWAVVAQVEDIEALDVGTSAPQAVHGGALLGVTYRQVLSRNQGGSNAFQFYSWITREPTGEVTPSPPPLAKDSLWYLLGSVYFNPRVSPMPDQKHCTRAFRLFCIREPSKNPLQNPRPSLSAEDGRPV